MPALYTLDLLGEVPQFYLNKEDKHRSLIGTLMTFVCIVTCILITLQNYFDIYRITNMSIIYNKNTNKFPIMNMTNHPFLFTLTDNYGNPIKDIDRVIRTHVIFMEREGTNVIMRNLTMQKCKSEDLGEYADNLSKDFDLYNYYCIPRNKYNVSLYGVLGDKFNKYSNLEIFVAKCFNDGYLPKLDCLNNSIINTRLQKVLMNVIYVDSEIAHDNLDKPYKGILKSVIIQGSSTVYRRYFSRKKSVSYTTDLGLFDENFKTETFFQQDFTESNNDLRVDDVLQPIFLQYSISFSDTYDVYLRKFIKFQSLLGNLSFIFKVIFYIGKILSNYFSKKDLYLNIYNNIFSRQKLYDESKNKKNIKFTLYDYRNKK